MVLEINEMEILLDSLEKEGRLREVNQPQEIEAIEKLSLEMEVVKREYKVMEKNSQIAASKTVLTS
jgi:hypothetical protein